VVHRRPAEEDGSALRPQEVRRFEFSSFGAPPSAKFTYRFQEKDKGPIDWRPLWGMRVGRGGNYPPGSFGGQDRLAPGSGSVKLTHYLAPDRFNACELRQVVAEIDLEWPSNHEIVLASNFLKEAFS
jgi:hypothetical protein